MSKKLTVYKYDIILFSTLLVNNFYNYVINMIPENIVNYLEDLVLS